jgi:hypothetical protein
MLPVALLQYPHRCPPPLPYHSTIPRDSLDAIADIQCRTLLSHSNKKYNLKGKKINTVKRRTKIYKYFGFVVTMSIYFLIKKGFDMF